MFWICDENSVDSTPMFYLLLNILQAFSVFHSAPPVSRLGVYKKLGEATAQTADPS